VNRSRRSIVGGLGAVALTVVTVLALPGVANAAALTTETVQFGSSSNQAPPATTTWDFTTTSHFWSIVGVYSDDDYDLTLSAAGRTLASSVYGAGRTDFIAIDSNDARRPLGAYRATVRRFSGTTNFAVEQMQGRFVTTLPVPANDGVSGAGDPDLAFTSISSNRVVRISDIFLVAGDAFWVKTTNLDGDVFFLESNPGDSSTWVRNRSSAVSSVNSRLVDGCTVYTAQYTGWHALAMVNNSWPVTTDPAGGTGHPLIQYSTSRPSSCPVKNFPGPTP